MCIYIYVCVCVCVCVCVWPTQRGVIEETLCTRTLSVRQKIPGKLFVLSVSEAVLFH
jgi:hypothetical protein